MSLNPIKRFFTPKLLLLLALYAIGLQLIIDFSSWINGNQSGFAISETLRDFLVNYPNVLLLCYLDYLLVKNLDKYWPWHFKRWVLVRVVAEIITGALIVGLLVVVVNVGIYLISGSETITLNAVLNSVVIGAIANLVLLPAVEFYFQYVRRYETALDNEWLKKENAYFQYELLKNQLNPHFLFNSLNTLLSLITIDQLRAKDFVRKLSHIYRHVLEYREQELIPLTKELEVLKDYIFLLQIRFGHNFQVSLDIPQVSPQVQVIPMALQMLLENTVKHNMVLEHKPLKVRIFSTEDYIIVENSLQPKKSQVSWGVGLKTIQSRYKQYHKSVEIYKDEHIFCVSLPLL
ncbi:MAG TPA: hypothetical protein DCS93_10100 [Microscillaceae bacterium]|nr:hypothetical protein [Microscillaceae bacterium]